MTERSEREEMYLITIARLMEAGWAPPVPLSQISAQLEIAPVSANQMIRRLEEDGLVNYTPYKGVSLTSRGMELALRILRHRRLWEVFLVEHLKYSPGDASQLACRLEHTLPCEAAERLAVFLGNPTLNPSGLPIPEENACSSPLNQVGLHAIDLNQPVLVSEFHADSATRSFFEAQGISPAQEIVILASASNGDLLVQTNQGFTVNLSRELVGKILVIPAVPSHKQQPN